MGDSPYKGMLPTQYVPGVDENPSIQALVEQKRRMKFAPDQKGLTDEGGIAQFLQQQLYGGGPNMFQRGFDQIVDMLPESPWEMIPGVGMTKKVPKVVDFNKFKQTGEIAAKRGRPAKQSPYKPMAGQDIPPSGERKPWGKMTHKERYELGKTREWQGLEPYDQMVRRYEGDPKMTGYIKAIEEKGYDEPYVGQSTLGWGWEKPDGMLHPIPVKNVRDLKGHLGKYVSEGGSDPFNWIDSKYGVTKNLLKQNYGKPLTISTRSDLIAHDDYMKSLNPKLHKIKIHLTGDHERVMRLLEPGNPSFKRRIKAAKKLREAGYDVTLVHDKFPNMPDGDHFNSLDIFNHEDLKGLIKNGVKIEENVVKGVPDELFEKAGFDFKSTE